MRGPTPTGPIPKQGPTRRRVLSFLLVFGVVVRAIMPPFEMLRRAQPQHAGTPLTMEQSKQQVRKVTTTRQKTTRSTSTSSAGTTPPLCEANPYTGALHESLDEISARMNQWLDAIASHHDRGDLEINRDHGRFFPFDSMATCTERDCVGGSCGSDTSKIVCGLRELSKNTSSLADEETCVVYSIGGNNQWEFELDILKKTPCEVHTFDCTGPRDRFNKPDHDRLHFHHVCIGARHQDAPPATECAGKAKCGETWTLAEMQQTLGHQRIDLFKIDAEGYEWPLLDRWPELSDPSSAEVVLPFQILVELHYEAWSADLYHPSQAIGSQLRFGRDLVLLQAHLLRMGYIVVERDDNPHCPCCTELTLVRARCHPNQSNQLID